MKTKPAGIIRKTAEVFAASLKLGLTSFGGPIAHLGYFHGEYVDRRRWIDERGYADLIALCQILPGPASSQMGMAIGAVRAGVAGSVAAWLGFTLPSAVILILFAFLIGRFDPAGAGWLRGLKIVAVAVVGQAVLSMWKKLVTGRALAAVALAAMVVILIRQTTATQVAVMLAAALAGVFLHRNSEPSRPLRLTIPVGRVFSVACLTAFLALLIALPLARQATGSRWLGIADGFYRSGALVFGGGHVVLPLLEAEFVPTGWVEKDVFVAGYAAAQAVPGPLFTFSAFLGAVTAGTGGAILALLSIFLPSFLLIMGVLPFWNSLRQNARIQGALIGINAAVVGVLLAALYHPVWTSSIRVPADLGLAAILFGMLTVWKWPSWTAVLAGAGGGMILSILKI